jgi:hypothetical protein
MRLHRSRWPLLVLLALGAGAAEGGMDFGARTQIWYFLYADPARSVVTSAADEAMKLGVATGNLDRYAVIGARWNIVDAWQELDGPDGLRRLDRAFAEHERRGIGVALRLLERPELYDDIGQGGKAAAKALADYRAWVGTIAQHYRGRVRYFMISNEVDHDIGYNRPVYRRNRPISFDEYRSVLREAYATIKAGSPDSVVLDHGVSSYTLCLTFMDELVRSGRLDEAVGFWRSMAYASPDEPERTTVRLLRMLARPDSRARVEMARRTIADLGPLRDAYQMHHYFGPAVLPTVLQWLRRGLDRGEPGEPIVAAEFGYRIPAKMGKAWDGSPAEVADMARYAEADHGASIARSLAIFGAHSVMDVLYWHIRFHNARTPVAGLYGPTERRDEFRDSWAARVFANMTRELTGATPVVVPGDARDPGMIEYRFEGARDLSVIWAAEGGSSTFPPGLRGRVAAVTDAAGDAIDLAAWNGAVTGAPLVVHWQAAATE